MIISAFGEAITFSCDDCGELLTTDTTDWHAARSILRSAYWRTVRYRGWKQYCRYCVGPTKTRLEKIQELLARAEKKSG